MKWLRKLIGTEDLYDQINDLNKYITGLRGEISRLSVDVTGIKGQAVATNRGIGRLIAKLDPLYAADELDPVRKRQSDEIGSQVIKKLISEHVISNRTNPDV